MDAAGMLMSWEGEVVGVSGRAEICRGSVECVQLRD